MVQPGAPTADSQGPWVSPSPEPSASWGAPTQSGPPQPPANAPQQPWQDVSAGTPAQPTPFTAPAQPRQDAPFTAPPQPRQDALPEQARQTEQPRQAEQPWQTSTPPPPPPPQQETPFDASPLTTAPPVPGGPPWQPPPAFTAAAAGMQVWPAPGQDLPDTSRWPAATGEPVWPEGSENEEPQDKESDETTVKVRKDVGQAVPPVRHGREQESGPRPETDAPEATPEPTPPTESAAPDQAPVPLGTDAPGVVSRALAPPPEQGDQPTPPRGIPVVTAPLPAPTGDKPPAPRPAVEVERGPFTPPSAVVQEAPPPPPAPPRKRVNTILLAAVVAVVVGGTGTGAFFAYQSFNAKRSASAEPPIPTSAPVEPTDDPNTPPEPDPINTEILNSEKTDPGKMTVADAFTKKVTLAGATFVRVKTDVTNKCDEAAAGRFASTLANQDCRQVLRATYVDSKRKYAVTTGIAVLPTLQSAVEVDRTKNLGSNLWFRGLPGSAGSGAERVGIAGGYAAGLVWGRYIVFSYATFSDGHTPTAKEKTLGKVSGAFRDETAKVVERRVTS
ncbi:hypothetical protein [Streptosporangium saharense]|uniref:hypothetical protein n=1 Tax=Streptosporangium saharense TaxID=1706840 RepID=UPI00368B978F